MSDTEIEIEFGGDGRTVRIKINGAVAKPGRGNPSSHKANDARHVRRLGSGEGGKDKSTVRFFEGLANFLGMTAIGRKPRP